MILIFILYFLFASTFTLGKELLISLPPFFLIGLRMIIGGSILLMGYIYFYGKPHIRRSDWMMLIRISFFHIYGAYLAEFWALQYVTAGKTALIYNLSPFITTIFARLILHERLSHLKIIGLFIGILGIIPVLVTIVPLENAVTRFSSAEIILLISVICSAIGWIFIKKTTERTHYNFLLLNALAMLIGGCGALVTSLYSQEYVRYASIPIESWPIIGIQLGLLIIIANIICYNLYGYLLQRYSAILLSFSGFLTPVYAAILSWILLGEVVEMSFWYSWTLTGIGSYIFYIDDKKRLPKL